MTVPPVTNQIALPVLATARVSQVRRREADERRKERGERKAKAADGALHVTDSAVARSSPRTQAALLSLKSGGA